MASNTLSFKKYETFAVLSQTRTTKLEFSLVKWGEKGRPIFDLRKWNIDDSPKKGISFDETSLGRIYLLLNSALNETLDKYKQPVKVVNTGKMIFKIFDDYGTFAQNIKKQEEKKIMLIDWGTGLKYDFRNWYYENNELRAGKGVSLSEPEVRVLYDVIQKLINEKSHRGICIDDGFIPSSPKEPLNSVVELDDKIASGIIDTIII